MRGSGREHTQNYPNIYMSMPGEGALGNGCVHERVPSCYGCPAVQYSSVFLPRAREGNKNAGLNGRIIDRL